MGRWVAMPKRRANAWVARKTKNIGARISTDSLTPRRFNRIRNTTPAKAKGSRQDCQATGIRENKASAPLATDKAMVRT